MPVGVDSVARAKAFVKRFALVFYGYYAWNAITKPEPAPDATRSLYAKGETAAGTETSFEALADTYVGHVDFLKRLLGDRTQVAFIYLPYSFAVHPDDIVRFPGVTDEDVPITRERIGAGIEAITARGVPILDTLPPLMKAASDRRLYYWLDIHFTLDGNRVVAEVATPFVQDLIDRPRVD